MFDKPMQNLSLATKENGHDLMSAYKRLLNAWVKAEQRLKERPPLRLGDVEVRPVRLAPKQAANDERRKRSR